MAYVKDLYHDEIREDFLVKANTKKVWNRQLEIWAEVDRICKKHGITYFAAYGTLLGAARHKGFIPWDADFDICMMRPEYNRFVKILSGELDDLFVAQDLGFDTTKIFHTQTTLLSRNFNFGKPTGILLDVFALDIIEDGTLESSRASDALKQAAALPDAENNIETLQRFAEELFGQSRAVAWFDDTIHDFGKKPFRKEWFDETIYLPFETVTIPAPKMFDEVLTSYYGDWQTPVRDGQARLGFVHSPDIPCEEFCRRVNVQELLRKNIQGGLANWLS